MNLQGFNRNLLQNTHDHLHRQGFQTSIIVSMITKHPALLTKSPAKIIENLEIWRGTQFGDKKLFELLERNPELLEFSDENHLRQKLANLKRYAMTTKNVWLLFMNSPNILIDSQKRIDSKIDYFKNIMKVDVVDVVKSTAFSHTLDSIKTRHIFLERLGLYKMKSPRAGPNEPNRNPRMHRIMDPMDKEFATKVAMVKYEEFEVFQALYKRELEKQIEDEEKEEEEEEEEE